MSKFNQLVRCSRAALISCVAAFSCWPAGAQEIFTEMFTFARPPALSEPAPQMTVENENLQLPAHLQKQIVDYPTREPAETIVIDTPHTFLYYVLGNGKAIRYGIGVGREGFTWSGVQIGRTQDRMAGLVSACRDDRASALFTAHGGGWAWQSARGSGFIYWWHAISYPWHQRSDQYRQARVEWLHSSHQRQRH